MLISHFIALGLLTAASAAVVPPPIVPPAPPLQSGGGGSSSGGQWRPLPYQSPSAPKAPVTPVIAPVAPLALPEDLKPELAPVAPLQTPELDIVQPIIALATRETEQVLPIAKRDRSKRRAEEARLLSIAI
jgi:hypothetical protein